MQRTKLGKVGLCAIVMLTLNGCGTDKSIDSPSNVSSTATPVSLTVTYGWICQEGDAGELYFSTKEAAENGAKDHVNENPNHKVTVDEVKSPDGSSPEPANVTAAKKIVDELVADLTKLSGDLDSVSPVVTNDPNPTTYAHNRKKIASQLRAVITEVEGANKSILAGLSLSEFAELRSYEALKLESLTPNIGLLNRDLSALEFVDRITNFPAPLNYLPVLPSEPIAIAKIDCGIYGPYHAEVRCPAYSQTPKCRCDKQFLGWGVAKCDCIAGAAVARPTPERLADQACSIPRTDYSCNLGGAVVSGTDFGCGADCVTGYKAVCLAAECSPPAWKPSFCGCRPR
jgi:hypothetical protein